MPFFGKKKKKNTGDPTETTPLFSETKPKPQPQPGNVPQPLQPNTGGSRKIKKSTKRKKTKKSIKRKKTKSTIKKKTTRKSKKKMMLPKVLNLL